MTYKKKVTIKDVAQAAGVSYATVSRAFSGSNEIGQETKRKILKLSAEMGYTPSSIARSMVIQKTNTLGLVLPSIQNPYMSELTSNLEILARKYSYNIMVCNSSYDPVIEQSAIELLMGKQVDGLFVMPAGLESFENIKNYISVVPTIFIGEKYQNLSANFVSVDNFTGAKIGTEYLYSLGHRKILYLGSRNNSVTHQRRLAGYMDACENLGIKPLLLNSNFQRSSQSSGYMLGKHLFSKALECTAVFCAADSLAIGVMQAADELGIKIPGDISLMGFDNISFTSLPRISLTTIDQSIEEISVAAIDLMIQKISGPNTDNTHRMLRPNLIERGSCAMIDVAENNSFM